MFKLPKFQLTEVKVGVVPGPLMPFAFEPQNQLQSTTGDKQVYIKGMKIYTSDMVVASPLTPANGCLQAADVPKTVLNLSIAGAFDFLQVPLSDLISTQGTVAPSNFFQWLIRNVHQVEWTKCTVQFIVAPVTPVPFSVLFGIAYDYVPDEYDFEVGYKSLHY
jgi:hypothetical protein